MGYIQHQAVIVTVNPLGVDLEVEQLRMKLALIVDEPFPKTAADLFVGPIAGLTNGYQTYVLAPDGSKEGWSASDVGDRARELVIRHFQNLAGCWPDIVQVTFGGDYESEFERATADSYSIAEG